ncbi:MAG: hypothetical protein WCA38_05275, partial [Candidatus Acidiferrales bacterium]
MARTSLPIITITWEHVTFFTSSTATTACPVLGVIDADTNEWIENFPTGKDASRMCFDLHGCPPRPI